MSSASSVLAEPCDAEASGACGVTVLDAPHATSGTPLDDARIVRSLRALMRRGSVHITERHVDCALLARRLRASCTARIDKYALYTQLAECCADMVRKHPDYGLLGGRVFVAAMHAQQRRMLAKIATAGAAAAVDAGEASFGGGEGVVAAAPAAEAAPALFFSAKMRACAEHRHPVTGAAYPLVRADFAQLVERNAAALDAMVDYERDYDYRYFGVCTLVRQSYLLKLGGQGAVDARGTIESPQDMLMRYALELYRDDMRGVRDCYEAAAAHLFTPATPSLMNAGTQHAQMSSCFLMQVPDDSLYSIYWTLLETAMISRTSGGIGLSVHNVRAANALIKKVNGKSNGLVPMLRAYNATARYVDQVWGNVPFPHTPSAGLGDGSGGVYGRRRRQRQRRRSRCGILLTRVCVCVCVCVFCARRAGASARAPSRSTSSRGTPTSATC